MHASLLRSAPALIGAGLAVMILGSYTGQLGVLTGFGLIALGATFATLHRQALVVWTHLTVYVLLYGLLAGALLHRGDLAATPLPRVLLRLDFAVSFILMVGVCRFSLPVLFEEPAARK